MPNPARNIAPAAVTAFTLPHKKSGLVYRKA